MQLEQIRLQTDKYQPFLDRLTMLNKDMTENYRKASEYYGFHCAGCNDNCCQTRFYHYTILEYLYLFIGFDRMDAEKQTRITVKAKEVCKQSIEAEQHGLPVRLMCPLNEGGRCILYEFRPMICRLHGIPHELHVPGHGVTYGSGCEAFTSQNHRKTYFKFDRTAFYVQMADLENKLKKTFGITQKFKMTVAQMFTSF